MVIRQLGKRKTVNFSDVFIKPSVSIPTVHLEESFKESPTKAKAITEDLDRTTKHPEPLHSHRDPLSPQNTNVNHSSRSSVKGFTFTRKRKTEAFTDNSLSHKVTQLDTHSRISSIVSTDSHDDDDDKNPQVEQRSEMKVSSFEKDLSFKDERTQNIKTIGNLDERKSIHSRRFVNFDKILKNEPIQQHQQSRRKTISFAKEYTVHFPQIDEPTMAITPLSEKRTIMMSPKPVVLKAAAVRSSLSSMKRRMSYHLRGRRNSSILLKYDKAKTSSPPSSLTAMKNEDHYEEPEDDEEQEKGLIPPHESIESCHWHSLVNLDLPPPLRLKQLILWSMKTVSLESKNTTTTSSLILELMEEVMKDLLMGEVSVSWYQRIHNVNEDQEGRGLPLKKNPRNEELKALIHHFSSICGKYEKEISEWDTMAEISKQTFEPIMESSFTENPLLVESKDYVLEQIQALYEKNEWLAHLPYKLDHFNYQLKVDHECLKESKQYCERVFKDLFKRCLGQMQQKDPLLLLKALSA